MEDPKLLERMRADWNRRAAEDANYYVAFGRRNQGEIHGVDVSDEMIRLARERLRTAPNAFPRHNSGSDLSAYPDAKFDFVYSYAVFQHIPSRDTVFGYLREARRVLKPGGLLRCQMNGLPREARRFDTWTGVRIPAGEVARFAEENEFQLLALEQAESQYMWITFRKPRPSARAAAAPPHLRKISNARTGEDASPASGELAVFSLWIDRLPENCDLIHLSVTADGLPCRPVYVEPPAPDGMSQINAALPLTGLVPVEVKWRGEPLCAGWTRILPAPPPAPRIVALSDGIDLFSGPRIATGSVKVAIVETTHPREFRATVDGVEAADWESSRIDPAMERYEFNFRLPRGIGRGPHEVRIALGRRTFLPIPIEVA
ncbi:MAG: class I SAM-dependent methyltransferase [Acidobacteriia bacterium]|nr:class I SAM-dependent methyltransferase [Terriglobia bacterium]